VEYATQANGSSYSCTTSGTHDALHNRACRALTNNRMNKDGTTKTKDAVPANGEVFIEYLTNVKQDQLDAAVYHQRYYHSFISLLD
jgi:hypothetical protein